MVLLPGCTCCGCDCPPSTCAYAMPISEPVAVAGHFNDCSGGSGNTATSATLTLPSIVPYTVASSRTSSPTTTISERASAAVLGWSKGWETVPYGVFGYRAAFELSASLECDPDATAGSRSYIKFDLLTSVVRSTEYGNDPSASAFGGQCLAIGLYRTATKKHFVGACESFPDRHCPSLGAEYRATPYRFWPYGFSGWVDFGGTSFGSWDSNVLSYGYIQGCSALESGYIVQINTALQSAIPRLSFSVELRESCDPNPLP